KDPRHRYPLKSWQQLPKLSLCFKAILVNPAYVSQIFPRLAVVTEKPRQIESINFCRAGVLNLPRPKPQDLPSRGINVRKKPHMFSFEIAQCLRRKYSCSSAQHRDRRDCFGLSFGVCQTKTGEEVRRTFAEDNFRKRLAFNNSDRPILAHAEAMRF